MNRSILQAELAELNSGDAFVISHDDFAEYFPPGIDDVGAKSTCFKFAQENNCRVENDIEARETRLVKIDA